MACEKIADELRELQFERRDVQEELRSAAPGAKGRLAGQIRMLMRLISLKQSELNACRAANPITPPRPPLNTSFTGNYTIALDHVAVRGQSFSGTFASAAVFNGPRTSIALLSFDPITAAFSTPVGMNTTTVTLTNSPTGSFDATARSITIGVPMRFDHSIDIPFYEEDSTISFPLGTGTMGALAGSPVSPAGATRLVGAGTFMGGYLGGSMAVLTLDGTFAASP